jgi:hypothetical protein
LEQRHHPDGALLKRSRSTVETEDMIDEMAVQEGRRRERQMIASRLRIEAYKRIHEPGHDPAYTDWLQLMASAIATGAYS